MPTEKDDTPGARRIPIAAGQHQLIHIAISCVRSRHYRGRSYSSLLQPDGDGQHLGEFIKAVLGNYFLGKGGDTPTNDALHEAEAILKAYKDYQLFAVPLGERIRRNSILVAMLTTYAQARQVALTGDPDGELAD